MNRIAGKWWRSALIAGATTAIVMTAGCGAVVPARAKPACATLPASDVPPLQKALTDQDSGSYCAPIGTTVLIVLKTKDLEPSSAWAPPSVTGPTGGTRWLSVPLTPLRGSTVAGLKLTAAGTYRVTSSARGRTWRVTVTASG